MSDSSLQFGAFSIDDSFLWSDNSPIVGSVTLRAITGAAGVYKRYVKDSFTITWPYLTQAQKVVLETELRAVGASAKHAVVYVSPQATRYYDAVHTSTNLPIIRGKVTVVSHSFKHFEGSANEWECVAECEET